MNVDTFLEQFGHLAEAPDGIKKLRELILDLAIRGKLVKQGTEAPINNLIEEIHKDRELQIKAGILKNEKEILKVDIEKFPNESVINWGCLPLGEIANIVRGVTFPGSVKTREKRSSHLPCLRTTNVQNKIVWDDLIYIPSEYVKREDQFVKQNDLIISMANSYELVGKIAIVNECKTLTTFGGFLAAIRPFVINQEYLSHYLRSPTIQLAMRSTSSQTTNIANISLKGIRPLPVHFPPLAEQKRIVAKVDELMALCDELETQQQQRQTVHAQLTTASLHQLTTAETPRQQTKAWQRIDTQFDQLFTTSESIKQLRQTILQLAVQGKLVPQDPEDEPAEKLLERIEVLRRELLLQKKVRKLNPFKPMDDIEPFSIPENWKWCRFGEILVDLRYGTSKKCSLKKSGIPVLRIPNIVRGKIDDTNLKYTALSEEERENLKLRTGDLLLIRSNGSESIVGRTAVVGTDDEIYAFAGYLVRLRSDPQNINATFLSQVFDSGLVRHQIEFPIRTTSGVKNINSTEIVNLLVPLPPLQEQERIVSKISQLMNLCEKLERDLENQKTSSANISSALSAAVLNQ
ncbi:restriction endonuclease subunit S [Gimesia fumaroli]|uniref:Type-1 restriction enzyme EcoKI specificity protein n=1 Tax=Gimesia fumaroli TaxID=2527976 RepID=A0A518IC13_9PLAN|nr:restriction endonuclease subunit S [Gimesia fumaroli]QDV50641.1 Type-1 restriction enzyme EcoKI specificity protein [Gimesia fumaroli]